MLYQLKALIFDVDGTLADTERHGHLPAFNRAFRDAGLDWEWSAELYGELLRITGGKERIRDYMERYQVDFLSTVDIDAYIVGLHKAKNFHYASMVRAGTIPLRPGVRRLLEEARRAKLRLAIATTTSLENVMALLEHCLDIHAVDWFEVIGAGDMVTAKKPAPDIYHYTLQALNLRPQECLALEDSANGLKAALAAGLDTVVTVSDYTRYDNFSGAALIVDHLGEPDQPCRVSYGAVGTSPLIDLPLLVRLHAERQRAMCRQQL